MNKINNVRVSKRFLSFVTSIVLMFSSLAALAEENTDENTNDNTTSISMMVETPEEELEEELVQFTYDEFIESAIEIIQEVEKIDKGYEEVEGYIPDAYFCVSSESFKDIAGQLISDGILSGDNSDSALTSAGETFRFLAHHNIKILEKKTKDAELFDISMFCTSQKQKELVHKADEYFKDAYEQATKNCDSYEKLIKIVEGFKEKNYIGLYNYYSNLLTIFYKHCLLSNYSQKELNQYYKSTIIFQMTLKNAYEMQKKFENEGPENEIEEYIELALNSMPEDKIDEWYKKYDELIQDII